MKTPVQYFGNGSEWRWTVYRDGVEAPYRATPVIGWQMEMSEKIEADDDCFYGTPVIINEDGIVIALRPETNELDRIAGFWCTEEEARSEASLRNWRNNNPDASVQDYRP